MAKQQVQRSGVAGTTTAAARRAAPAGEISGAAWATAFEGTAERVSTPPLYRLSVLLVFVVMILLPLVYLAIIVGAAMGVMWYADAAKGMFTAVRGRGVILVMVIYVAPLIAGALLVLFMILPLFWRRQKEERPMWVDRNEQPLLYAYVEKLCDAMGAPRPARIDVMPNANASAHIDNGLIGILFSRRLVLTIGLPLALGMDLRQFTGVLAHEFGHFTQGWFMRLSYAVGRINGWFARLAYERGGIDEMLDNMIGEESHWTVTIVALVAKFVLGLARLVLKLMAIVSHALSMHLSRQAEFDADRRAARVVGSDAMGRALEGIPYVGVAGDIAMERVQEGWERRQLPDDLVLITEAYRRGMPEEVKAKITAGILEEESSWFDTHPPLFKRIAALRKLGLKGLLRLNGPATALFKDFHELSKLSTISFYQLALGKKLRPEHLVETKLA